MILHDGVGALVCALLDPNLQLAHLVGRHGEVFELRLLVEVRPVEARRGRVGGCVRLVRRERADARVRRIVRVEVVEREDEFRRDVRVGVGRGDATRARDLEAPLQRRRAERVVPAELARKEILREAALIRAAPVIRGELDDAHFVRVRRDEVRRVDLQVGDEALDTPGRFRRQGTVGEPLHERSSRVEGRPRELRGLARPLEFEIVAHAVDLLEVERLRGQPLAWEISRPVVIRANQIRLILDHVCPQRGGNILRRARALDLDEFGIKRRRRAAHRHLGGVIARREAARFEEERATVDGGI